MGGSETAAARVTYISMGWGGAMKRNVATVVFISNGRVMVFDRDGNQIPKLQGPWQKRYKKVLRRCDEYTQFWTGVWDPQSVHICKVFAYVREGETL